MSFSNQKSISRRTLLKGVSLSAGALLAACAAPPAAAPKAAEAPKPTEAAKPTEAPAAATEAPKTEEPTKAPEPTATPATSSGPVTLKWGFWGDPEEVKVHQSVADAFAAKNADIKVEINTAPWNDYNTKLKTQIASGDALDDVFWYAFNVQEIAEQGVIENLTPYAEKTGFDLKDYWPGTLDQVTYKGGIYGLVRDADASLLYYNKDILAETKIDAPTEKWTLDDLAGAAEKLSQIEGSGRVTRYGLASESGKINAFLVGNGGGYVDNVQNPSKSILDSKESLQVLNWFYTLISKNFAIKPDALSQAGGDTAIFQKGQAAFIIQNASRIPAFNAANLNYDIAPLPLPWSGKRANNAGGARWLLDAKGKNKDAAWTFLSFLNSADGGNGIYAKSGGIFPAQKSVATSAAFTDPNQKPANRKAFEIEGAGLALLTPGPILPAWQEIDSSIVSPALGKVWALEDTPDKAVAALVPAINEALKKAGFPK